MKAERIPLAIVVGTASPYRVQLHRRIVSELPEIELQTVLLHDHSVQSWEGEDLEGIGLRQFGRGEGVVFPMTPGRALAEWRKGGEICAELEQSGVRVVMVCGWNNPALHRVLGWARSRGVRSMLWADGTRGSDRSAGAKRRAKRVVAGRAIARADMALTTGIEGERFMRDLGARTVERFPYEPDAPLIRSVTAEERARVLVKYGLDPSRRHVLCSGRLATGRGWDLAIRAFAAIAPRRPEWDLVFLGSGDAEQELRLLVPGEFRERVRWCGFIADQREVASVYRESHVLLHPAEHEPWGVPVHEGLAAGMAVVVSDGVGCVPDLVREGVNGLVFTRGDSSGLREKLLAATEAGAMERFRGNALASLREWYLKNDPVKGLYEAMGGLGLLAFDPARAHAIAAARARLVAS